MTDKGHHADRSPRTAEELERAERKLREALEASERLGLVAESAPMWARLGRVCEQRGATARALEAWNRALELYGDLGRAEQVRKIRRWIDELPL